MRFLVVLALLLLSTVPVLAQGWDRYVNARFGFAIDVPPDFRGSGESQNGDGQHFSNTRGTQSLAAYGGAIVLDRDFEGAAARASQSHQSEGWRLSYESTTPRWASYSGLRNGQVLYVRMIALCGGTQFAAFELQYPQGDIADMTPVVERLVGGFRATERSAGC